MHTYRLVLYRNIDSHWHYVRLTASTGEGLLRTEQGQCGFTPQESELLPLPAGSNPDMVVRKAGELWQALGYHPVTFSQFPVMTLHFKMPRWRGLLPAAPWFDEWVRFYFDPIRESFEKTCNGVFKGEERFAGNYMLYYTIFNPAMARQVVALAAAASPEQFDLEISISDQGKTVSIPIDAEVPQFLQEFLRGFENTARAISNGLSSVHLQDPLQPELVNNRHQHRILGADAQAIFQQLKMKWRFEYAIWDPANSQLPLENAYFQEFQKPARQYAIKNLFRTHSPRGIIFLDFENGLFRIEPEALFTGIWEGLVFDESFEWFLYTTNYYTINVGGQWLGAALRELQSTVPTGG
ncbi:MAG: hypothetical protein IPL65_13655 [Lewinellaceae bacterium]|nr:hypothetical protein [Lewinellaceae bacterium]